MSGRRAVVRVLLLLALLAATTWITARLVAAAGWEEVRGELARSDLRLVLAAAGLKAAMFGVWSWRWRLAVAQLERPPAGWMLAGAHAAGVLINHVAPGARLLGGLARVRYLRRLSRVPTARALAAVVFDQAVQLLTMGTFGVLGVAIAAVWLDRPGIAVLALGAGLTAAVLLDLQRRRQGRGFTRRLAERLAARALDGRSGMLLAGAGEAAGSLAQLAETPWLRRRAASLSLLMFSLNAGSQWTVFLALGEPVDPWVAAVGVAVGAAAGTLAATPGGLGGTEAAMIGLYTALSIDAAAGSAGTLLFRAVHYAVVLGTGVPALLVLELRGRRAA